MLDKWDGSQRPAYEFIYDLEINLGRVLEFLTAITYELAGNAFISFEGYFSQCEPFWIPGLSSDETDLLKRKAIFPVLDFVVLPLEADTVDEILALLKNDPCLGQSIVHIEIAKYGKIAYGSYDSFLPTLCGPFVSPQFLDALLQKGIVKSIRGPDPPFLEG